MNMKIICSECNNAFELESVSVNTYEIVIEIEPCKCTLKKNINDSERPKPLYKKGEIVKLSKFYNNDPNLCFEITYEPKWQDEQYYYELEDTIFGMMYDDIEEKYITKK